MVALLTGCGDVAPATPQAPPSPSATSLGQEGRLAGWEADLRTLITAREEFHAEPWHGIDRETYVAEVEEVIGRIGELSDDELLVETVRLAAMPTWAGRDGHGGIYPWGEGDYGTHLYPLRLYLFSDGVFVVDALSPHRDLVGDRVTTLGDHDVDDVLRAVEPLVPRDNGQQVLSQGPRLMVTAEVLHGLGLIEDPAVPLRIGFAQAGERQIVPVPMVAYERWAGGHFSLTVPPRPTGAPWVSRLEEPSWFEWRPDTGTLFIQYNAVVGRMPSAIEEIAARSDDGRPERIVVDVRHNGGGDNTTYGGFVRALREADAEGIRLYVIIGRQTFSAAGNFVTELEATTDAILVGEDLGSSPNQYGDAVQVRLEHSGLVLRIAPIHQVKSEPDDPRITIEPDIRVELSSADYFGDVDPAMEAILADS